MFRKLLKNASKTHGQEAIFRVAASERVYAIGDIHGRYDLTNAILEKISNDIKLFSDRRRPRFIFMGDYIDRGDHSRDVLEMLSDFAKSREQIVKEVNVQIDFLAGNHEIAMLNFLQNPLASREWLSWGGLQTLGSFGIVPGPGRLSDTQLVKVRDDLAREAEPFMEFLTGLPRIIVSGQVVFVHASLDPTLPLDEQPDDATLWGRLPHGQKFGLEGYRVVHGHFDSYEPVSLPERVCVDTGAYYSGRLTAVRLDEGEEFLYADTADLLDEPSL